VCETLLRAWRTVHRGAPGASTRIWLYGLATDVCLEAIDGRDESWPDVDREPAHDRVGDVARAALR
jgi:DNA-directed RNA polymerase specialized sigma24 family protein